MADSDLVGCDRVKRVAAMDDPDLLGYHENLFIERLHPERMDAALAAEAFRVNRRFTAAVLRELGPESFARGGLHNEYGPVTLEGLIRTYIKHVEHHAEFARGKRAALGVA